MREREWYERVYRGRGDSMRQPRLLVGHPVREQIRDRVMSGYGAENFWAAPIDGQT